MNTNYDIIHADFVKWLRGNQWLVQNGHIKKYHAVLADPPYGLEFMSKGWDAYTPQNYQAWVTEWASMLLDFVHPGGILMMFGGTRTYHRLVAGLEDAGWEIYDSIMVWTYGSGFPKSHDISKGIDRAAPRVGLFDKFAAHYTECRRMKGLTHNQICQYGKFYAEHNHGGASSNWESGANVPTLEQWRILQPLLALSNEYLPLIKRVEADRDVIEKRNDTGKRHIAILGTEENEYNITTPATPEAAQWEGYGTSLKPAHENIVLARKPRGRLTYAECALQFGSGALNIDGGRIGMFSSDHDDYMNKRESFRGVTGKQHPRSAAMNKYSPYLSPEQETAKSHLGRWPSNTILIHHPDCSDNECVEACHVRVLGEMSGELTSGARGGRHSESMFTSGTYIQDDYDSSSGSAARFFYQAKSPQWERDAGISGDSISGGGSVNHPKADAYQARKTDRHNPHPTVKPIKLCEYLAKLLLPPIDNSRLLVPFAGSGSEMIGARLAGWDSITGIEMTNEYIPIARARLKWWSGFGSYEAAKVSATSAMRGQVIEEKKAASGQLNMFSWGV